MKYAPYVLTAAVLLLLGCGRAPAGKTEGAAEEGIMFKDDVAFLKTHTQVVVLTDAAGQAQLAVNPDLQGRIMTSTASGSDGLSFGWINREPLASGENNVHMNAFGGEDRFWLGPEGGQFSIFFKKGDPFDLEHWFTPPPINEGAFEVVEQTAGKIVFRKLMRLVNYSGAAFELEASREVALLTAEELAGLGIAPPAGLRWVAFHSLNGIRNTGTETWTKESGLLSIWILGMFNPSPATTIIVPFRSGPDTARFPVVNDSYFGKVPPDRLAVRHDPGVIFFKGDGLYRSKIGIVPRRASSFIGSYDADHNVLTVVKVSVEAAAPYVNPMWEIQAQPYAGDAVNSYNDGPASPGAKPLGPFYELETSSPAAALKPGETMSHRHVTAHFQGERAALEALAKAIFGVGLDDIQNAFR